MRIPIFFFLLFAVSVRTLACDQNGKTGILPENDLWIGVNEKANSNIDEKKFHEILDHVEAIYAPIIKELGGILQLERKWDDGTVNAYAKRSGKVWEVHMFGGLARHQAVTPDGFALVICHEIGHHIGGSPKKESWYGGAAWASNEGQADYFGTLKCLRKFSENEDNIALMRRKTVDRMASNACREAFQRPEEIAICERGSMAGLSLASLFKALLNIEKPLRFDTPDKKIVRSTFHNHPKPQCRLDTYFNGAICEKEHYVDITDDKEQAALAECHRKDGYLQGIKPLCWYKPPTDA